MLYFPTKGLLYILDVEEVHRHDVDPAPIHSAAKIIRSTGQAITIFIITPQAVDILHLLCEMLLRRLDPRRQKICCSGLSEIEG